MNTLLQQSYITNLWILTNVTSGFSLNKRSSKQKGNLEWTIQRHWQHRAHMTRDKEPITCHKTWYGSHIVKTCFTPLCVSKQKNTEIRHGHSNKHVGVKKNRISF